MVKQQNKEIAMFNAIVGSSTLLAKEKVIAAGMKWRITAEDGKRYMVTHDFKTDRINVEITNGMITRATIG